MTSQRTRERLIQRLQTQGVSDPAVLDAMRMIPRHLFLDEALAHRAYEDTALPIGYGQTISQPYVVARMSQLLLSRGPRRKVLEIGTGSGYQAAILSRLVAEVHTVERLQPLLLKARERFRRLRLGNVFASHRDGVLGAPERAPYDAIIGTAAPTAVPEQLLRQLAPEGMLILPVGAGGEQELRLIVRQGNSAHYSETVVERVRFVPMVGGICR